MTILHKSTIKINWNMNLFILYYSCIDEICRNGDGKTANSICRNIERCPVAKEGLKKHIIPQLCSFNGSTPIVCCPPEKNTNNEITTTTKKPSTNPVLKSYSATESMYRQIASKYYKNFNILFNNYSYLFLSHTKSVQWVLKINLSYRKGRNIK